MIDLIDYKILKHLWDDGRMSVTALSERINLSHTPTLKRIERLKEEGFITGFRAVLSEQDLGGAMTVFTSVSLKGQSRGQMEEFETMALNSAEVSDCFLMTGDADYMMRVTVDTLEQFEAFLSERVSNLKCVSGIKSSVALRSVVQGRIPPQVQNALSAMKHSK